MKHNLQLGHTLVIQRIGKHQHRGIVEVRHGLQLVGVGKQHTLTGVGADNLAILGTAISRIKAKPYSIGQLSLQRISISQGNVINNLTKGGNHCLAHGRLCRQHAHHIGVTLKGLADEHVLQKLPAHCTQLLLSANTINHLRQLCLWYDTCMVKVRHRAKARLCIIVEVAQCVIAVDSPDNPPETFIAHRLAKLHGLLSLVLRLHLLLVEPRKGLCRVGHSLIGNERHPRVLHPLHLLGGEAKLRRIFFQIVQVCTVGIVTRCKFTGHGTTISRQHDTIIAHNRNTLQGSLVILPCNAPCVLLSVTITLIVPVVHTVVIGIHRETVRHLPCLGVVARG